MSLIEIEDISGLELDRHAYEAVKLVDSEKKWLKEVRPDVWARHNTIERSRKALGRIVMDEDIAAHFIRIDKVVSGMLTIIQKLTIYNPNEDVTVSGRQIDLWTREGVSNKEHYDIVEQAATHGGYTGTVIGLLTPREAERAQGFATYMHPIGVPTWLKVVGIDRFGINELNQVQLLSAEV